MGGPCAYLVLHLCEGGGFTSWHLESIFSERICALKMVRMARDNIRRSIFVYMCVFGVLPLGSFNLVHSAHIYNVYRSQGS